jgi:hypothetical protein
MANKPLCSDDADTTRRLAALEAALGGVDLAALAQAVADLEQDVVALDSRVTSLEGGA